MLNTRNSSTAEFVAVDDVNVSVLWIKGLLEAQVYNIRKNAIFQDIQSEILLVSNRRKIAGKSSRNRFF